MNENCILQKPKKIKNLKKTEEGEEEKNSQRMYIKLCKNMSQGLLIWVVADLQAQKFCIKYNEKSQLICQRLKFFVFIPSWKNIHPYMFKWGQGQGKTKQTAWKYSLFPSGKSELNFQFHRGFKAGIRPTILYQ